MSMFSVYRTATQPDSPSAQDGTAGAARAVRVTTGMVQAFFYLQVLDLLTTLVGFRVGAAESSPFIRVLMHAGPAPGVAAAKLLALVIGGICVYTNRGHLLRRLTYLSAALVVWNLMVILSATGLR